MLNLNPELVDQDKIRKARRKRLLKIAIVPCILILLCSLFVFRVGFFNVMYSVSYDNQNFDIASSVTDFQGVGNVITPYIKHYDSGIINLRKGEYVKAENDFRSSLKENPPAEILCNIYVNLALSIEMQADEQYRKENYEDSLVLYTKARSTLYSNGCADKNADSEKDESKDEKAKESAKRIEKKYTTAMNKMNYAKDDDGGDSGGGSPDKMITKEQEEKIKDRREKQKEIMWDVQNSVRGGYGVSGSKCSYNDSNICW